MASKTETWGGIGSDAVRAATGKTWKQWLTHLDKAGAKKLNHKEIVDIVRDHFGVGPWWRQMVTVGYEQARGLRRKHEKPGGYEIGKSKTILSPVGKVFSAWVDQPTRRRWLADAKLTIRKATRPKSVRIAWGNGESTLDVNLYPKGVGKCQVTVQHGKLPSADQAEKMKTYWADKLDRLKKLAEA